MAVAVHAALLGVAGQLRIRVVQPAASGQQPEPPRSVSRLTFLRLDPSRAAASGAEPRRRRGVSPGPLPARRLRTPAPTEAGTPQPRPTPSSPSPATPSAATDRLATPLLPVLPAVDPRLYAREPLSATERQLQASMDALRDSLRRAPSRPPAGGNWTLSLGDGGRLGVSSGIVLHFGHLTIPVPLKAVHLRDLGPEARARRSMIDEIREQAERVRRDSIVAARRRP